MKNFSGSYLGVILNIINDEKNSQKYFVKSDLDNARIELDNLLKSSKVLDALCEYGVDNWGGYDDAISSILEE